MKKTSMRLLAAGAVLTFCSAAATAATLDIDVSGIESWGSPGDLDNVVLSIDLGAGSTITGIGWDVTLTPDGASWYSEPTATISDSAFGQAVSVTPGAADEFSGSGIPLPYSSGGILDLTDNGIADIILADGIMLIEFSESFDDVAGAVDALWGGTLTVEYDTAVVPVPAALWLFGSGLLGLMGLRRNAAA